MEPISTTENHKPIILVEIFGMLAACIGLSALFGWSIGIQFLTKFGSGMIPMAPSTALLFVVMGTVIFSRTHFQQTKIVSKIEIAVSVTTILTGILLLFTSLTGMYLQIEHLGFSISDSFGGIPIGHMSPITATCFVLTGLSFLFILLPKSSPKQKLIPLGLGILVVLVSVFLLVEYLFESPLLYGTTLIPPALTTSVAFLFLGTSLIIFTIYQYGFYTKIAETLNTRTSVVLVLIFVFVSIAILIIGYLYFQNYQKRYRKENERQLSLVADFKVSELVRWRHERMIDGSFFYKNYEFSTLVTRYFNNPDDLDAKHQIESLLHRVYNTDEYDALTLLDKHYLKKIVVSKGEERTKSFFSQQSIDSINAGKLVLEDFYYNETRNKKYLKVLVPIFQKKDNNYIIGVVEMRIDPERYLFPYIQKWPTLSKTAETIILRREANEVLFLNKLRFQKNINLDLRRSLTIKNMPAVQAALGYEGIMEGIDYRGMPVLAALRTVPNSPWFLVARIDITEIYEPLKEKLWQTILLISALLISAGAVIGLMLRNQRTRFYREKHEAADKLITSELRYRRLFETAKDGILILDVETGKIVDANPFLIEMLGYSHEQFLGKTIWEIGFFKDVAANRENFLELQRKEYIRYEDLPLKTMDGHQINVEFVSNVYMAGHKKVIQCNIRDITERKQAEEEIKQNENRLKSLVEILQHESDTIQGFLDYALDHAIKLTGSKIGYIYHYSEEKKEFTLNSWSQEVMKECTILEQQTVYELDKTGLWGEAVRQRKPIMVNDFQAQNPLKKGYPAGHAHLSKYLTVPIRRENKIVGVVAVANKVTDYTETDVLQLTLLMNAVWKVAEQKQAEEALKESENRFRAIFEQAAVGVALLNTKTGQFIRINKKYCDFVGYTSQEMLQKSLIDITYSEDLQKNLDMNEQLIDGISREFSLEKRYVHRDGTILWGKLTISPLWKPGEKPETYYHIAIVEDITERKHDEVMIQQQNIQLRELNSTKDKFFSIIAHDLRSPFQGFLGMTEMIIENISEFTTEELLKFIRELNKSAQNLYKLLQNLLDWAQLKKGSFDFTPEEFSLSATVSASIEQINKRAIQKGITILSDVPENQKIFVDERMINSILGNLLSNAVKFTAKGGSVSIKSKTNSTGMVEIAVEDTGIGMSERIVDKLFKIDEKAGRKGTDGELSTGLGLLLCKEFVEKNGGKIWAESEEGKGSCFMFTIPSSS